MRKTNIVLKSLSSLSQPAAMHMASLFVPALPVAGNLCSDNDIYGVIR